MLCTVLESRNFVKLWCQQNFFKIFAVNLQILLYVQKYLCILHYGTWESTESLQIYLGMGNNLYVIPYVWFIYCIYKKS